VPQVLCGVEAMWQNASEGHVPADALPVGTTRDGERLYVGRVFHDGTLTPGKVKQVYLPENYFISSFIFL
jgi:hypothetical protein